MKDTLTPMMRQYQEIKSRYADAILFFRLGDFYEMFGEDAKEAVSILGITLTARSKGEDKVPMCGVPYHSAARYIARLNKAGKRVAICEQVSDPALPGIVQREVVKVITPGTTLDENILSPESCNFLIGIHGGAFSVADLSTGYLAVSKLQKNDQILDEILKLTPVEIVFAEENEIISELRIRLDQGYYYCIDKSSIDDSYLTKYFTHEALQDLNADERKSLEILLEYIRKTQLQSSISFGNFERIVASSFLPLDQNTIRNLEILESMRDKEQSGSLLGILNKAVTNSGKRLLKQVLVKPLQKISEIEKRQNLIECFLSRQNLLMDFRLLLKDLGDPERMLARLGLKSGNARDLRGLAEAFMRMGEIKDILGKSAAKELIPLIENLDYLANEIELINSAIKEETPISVKEGGLINDGFDQEIDNLRSISRNAKSFIQEMQAREIARTGINSLKIKYNRVFGYYIEISKANLKQIPEDYTRKQTLVNAERFTTNELKEYEVKVLSAEEEINSLEEKLFENIRERILKKSEIIKKNCRVVAWLDIFASQALVAWENRYVKPEMHEGFDLEIINGRHPVIEKLNPTDRFVANDLVLSEKERLMLITGPNMGGKSTLMRQNAVIVLMAHLGFYVPAERARIALTDRIFTRVGASDNLVRGQSTFWVEMEETAKILEGASEKSLVILDEIGRGTSTFDGLSLAWGILEYLHDRIKCKCLFASHYHELIELADKLPRATNFSVQVQENGHDIVFLYRVARGGVNKSYGLQVAKLAGLPVAVLNRSGEILKQLETQKNEAFDGEKIQGNLFEEKLENSVQDLIADRSQRAVSLQILDKLKSVDINAMTPIKAFDLMRELIAETDKPDKNE